MPLGLNALNLTNDELAKWLLEDFPLKVQHLRIWPFRSVAGGSLRFASTDELKPAEPIDHCALITEQTSAPIDPPKVFQFGELATNFRICYSADDRFQVPNDLQAVEHANAVRRLLYEFSFLLDTGNAANPGEFPSLLNIADPTNILNLAGAVPVLENFDDVYYRVDDNDGRPNAIMSNSRALRRFLAANYVRGFQPEFVVDTWQDPIRGTVEAPRTVLHGTYWYLNDLIQTRVVAGVNVSNIYFMVLGDHGEPGPGHGVTGIVPEPMAGTMFRKRETLQPGGSTKFVDWTWPVGIAMGSKSALSVMQDAAVL